MSLEPDAMPVLPKRPEVPTETPPVVGEESDAIGDDRFEAMLDRALEVAFAPIIEEYRVSRERSLADAPPVSPEPVSGGPGAIPDPEGGEDPAVTPTLESPSDPSPKEG